METKTNVLKLNIKGSIRNWLSRITLNYKLRKMGVKLNKLHDHSVNHVEMLLEGDRKDLWNAVSWSKGSDVFVFLNEVIFEFVDVGSYR